MNNTREYEVAVVGGGPGGLSAALWLGRYLHSVVLIDSGDPRNWETAGINGYLGLPGVKPAALREAGRRECRRYEVELVDACVDRATRTGIEQFELTLEDGTPYRARRVVLAIGLKDVWPDISGLDRCYGRSAHHCPDCDGYDARDCQTVVVGQGKKAVALALALTTWTNEIIVCTNGAPANMEQDHLHKLKALNIPVIETRVRQALSTRGKLRYLELEDGMPLNCEKLFFTIDSHPARDLGSQLECMRDDSGQIEVDSRQRTSTEHVYAVGDITPGPKLAIAAAAEGTMAAASIHRSLIPESRRL